VTFLEDIISKKGNFFFRMKIFPFLDSKFVFLGWQNFSFLDDKISFLGWQNFFF